MSLESEHALGDGRVGHCLVSPGRTVTEADLVTFAGITGDWNPIHSDAEFAAQSKFGERIAHGMLTLALGTGLLFRRDVSEEFFDSEIVALAGLDRIRFVEPVKIGDTIHLECDIHDRKSMGKDLELVFLRFRVKNQCGAVALTGRCKIQAKRHGDSERPS